MKYLFGTRSGMFLVLTIYSESISSTKTTKAWMVLANISLRIIWDNGDL